MNYKNELDFAVDLARQAGKIMQRYFRADDIGTIFKDNDTPLTIADTKINSLVIQKVKTSYPQHAVIGEEESFHNTGEFVWVVDPIDGTIPFSLGMPFSSFSLGLVNKNTGQSVVGVVYDPPSDELYTATIDGGAYRNGKQIKTNNAEVYSRNYFSVIGGNIDKEKPNFAQGFCIDFISENGGKCLNLQSQVYGAVRVASGELAGSLFDYGSPWDSAAASLIVTEAGGIVTDIFGKPRRYDEFADGCVLSANQAMHDKLIELIKQSNL